MIGFDIVDFQVALAGRSHTDKRLQAKILNEHELLELNSIGLNEGSFWFIWAAKECVYKAISVDGESFNPLRISMQEIQVDGDQMQAQFTFKGKRIYCRGSYDHQHEKLSCFAALSETDLDKIQLRSFESPEDELKNIQRDLYKQLELYLDQTDHRGYLVSHLESGRPILQKAQDQQRNISLSHHGRFAGFAYLPR